MKGFMQFGMIDNVKFTRKFIRIMDGSMNTLKNDQGMKSREEFAQWMCVQHNIFKIEKVHNEFEEMTVE